MKRLKRLCLSLLLLAVPAIAHADCRDLTKGGNSYTVCSFDPARADLRLFRVDGDDLLGSFRRVDQMLERDGKALSFAMNAGMYHQDRSPVGLYVEEFDQQMRIITSEGPGNFGLLPNGVFCLAPGGSAAVIESRGFADREGTCRFATQSGPMLVIDGALHPRFLPESDSLYTRNGVGVDEQGMVHFAISNQPVRFYDFGLLFRDALKTPNALYFDGKVSRLYAPDLNRHDGGFPMGPIVGAVVDLPR